MVMNRRTFVSLCALSALALGGVAHAQKKYGPGVTDTEIKLGQTMPYSGPASAYGTIGKTEVAYFKMINDKGGINGRKVNLLSLDDGYSPPKAVEQVRKLVEQEQVLALFQTLGTASNSAIHKYVNNKKVPHLFVSTGAAKWNDPKNYPWTVGYNLNYQFEAKIVARHLLKTKPGAKVAVLYQNDDLGKDYLQGFKDGLGDRAAKMIVAEASYEVTDPTIDSQMIQLQASGADTFYNITTPKFAAQAIRKAYDSQWRPLHFLASVASLRSLVLEPAGLNKSKDIFSVRYLKTVDEPGSDTDPAVREYLDFMKQYHPDAKALDLANVYAYNAAVLMTLVLQRCGDDLTRENLLKQATSLKDLDLPLSPPGVKINTSADDYSVYSQGQLIRFDGDHWRGVGEVLGGR
jgi:branched-chain amino acid transport system substrate-binding protein